MIRFLIFLSIIAGLVSLVTVPQFTKGQEKRFANETSAVIKMIATTNRMYSLDAQRRWTEGLIHDGCNTARCSVPPGPGPHSACNLIACRYLAQQTWDGRKYRYYSLDPNADAAATNVCGDFPTAAKWVACAVRKTAADGQGTAPKFSAGWGYAVTDNGAIHASLQAAGADPTPRPK